jgi:hypothetical protein
MPTEGRDRASTEDRVDGPARRARIAAAVLSAVVAVAYAVLLFQVNEAEAAPGATDTTTWGGYLYLALLYAVGSALLLSRAGGWVVAVGLVAQVVVLGLFVVFGVGLLGPGVFDYAALADVPVVAWAVFVTTAQVAILGLLAPQALGLWRRLDRTAR